MNKVKPGTNVWQRICIVSAPNNPRVGHGGCIGSSIGITLPIKHSTRMTAFEVVYERRSPTLIKFLP